MDYNTFRKISQPIRFAGLSPVQFAIMACAVCITLIVMIFVQIHPLVIVGVLMLVFFVLSALFKTLKKEHKKGNPDYLQGKTVWNGTPRQIIDKSKIFNFILK